MQARSTWLDVNLAALVRNFHAACRLAHGQPVLAVVKGNGYGHGLVAVSQALVAAGAAFLGVATIDEGRRLRKAGLELPILLLGGYSGDEADALVAARLTPALFTLSQIEALSGAARRAGIRLPVHVKVDTGMGRIGLPWADAHAVIQKIAASPDLRVEGVFTHFAEADLADSRNAREQLERFAGIAERLGDAARNIPYWHAANSAALMRGLIPAGSSLMSLSRPGIMLYGILPDAAFHADTPLEPVATWKARILQIKRVPAGTPISYARTFVTERPSRIATLPVGYADGFRRELSNQGEVLVRGQRAPVVGRVCMDMTMVDISALPEDVAEGDECVLMGRQGTGEITAQEIAVRCGTIAYDILCGISDRVPRRYPEGEGTLRGSRPVSG